MKKKKDDTVTNVMVTVINWTDWVWHVAAYLIVSIRHDRVAGGQ